MLTAEDLVRAASLVLPKGAMNVSFHLNTKTNFTLAVHKMEVIQNHGVIKKKAAGVTAKVERAQIEVSFNIYVAEPNN